jgi:hypothetical protein
MNNCLVARKKAIYWGIAMGSSGPIGYRAAVFMKAVGCRAKKAIVRTFSERCAMKIG